MTDTPFTESPWFYGLLGPALVVCIAVIYTRTMTSLAKSRLPRLFARRSPAAAFDSCRAALPGVDPARVLKAYRWVQELVPYPDPPIQASDRLGRDLFVSRRGMLFLLTESAMQRNPSKSHHQSALYSVRTVADLMAEILRNGYEGQVRDPSAEPVAWH